MILYIDTKEKLGLREEFPAMKGITIQEKALDAGDYTALHQHTGADAMDGSVVERKSCADLFTSFSSNYEAEKAKWERAQGAGLQYILAVEGTVSEILRGYTYWAGGELREARKTGIAQIRQLFSISRRYGVILWFCASRKEMALRILEWFLAAERIKPEGKPVESVGRAGD